MMSVSSRREQAAERNVRLDPQGIYGTRSARRQNQLRRRRQAQNLILWFIGALALAFFIWWLLQPRQSARGASWTRQLPFRPATRPFLAPRVAGQNFKGDVALLFSSQSGGLWRWNAASAPPGAGAPANWPSQAPHRVFSTAFSPAALPLVSGNQIFWPGGDGILRALDVSGTQKWRGVLGSSLVCTPASAQVFGRKVVAAADDSGEVAAFDAASGRLLWKVGLGGACGAALGTFSDPAAIPTQPPPVTAAGVTTDVTSAVTSTAQNGLKRGVGAAFLVPLLPGVGSRGGLVCLDASSGKIRWRFPGDARLQSGGVAAPLVRGDRVFWCNDESAAVCLDTRSGKKIWKSFAASSAQSAAGASHDTLVSLRGGAAISQAAGVVAFGGNDGVLRGYDLATGAPRWNQNLGGPLRFPAQTVVFEGQNAFLAAGDAPAIFLLDAATGSIVRRWTVPFPVSNGFFATNNNVYALDMGGHLQVAALQ